MATPQPEKRAASGLSGRRRSEWSGDGGDDDSDDSSEDPLVTVFKKSSRNEKVTVFMGNREVIDNGVKAPTLDGVVYADLDFVGDQNKVFVQLLGSFEYGTADLDILGLSFQKDLYRAVVQAFPGEGEDSPHPLTPFQERLIEKLGSDTAFPFWFELASNTPSSVTLQPYGSDGVEEAPCGIFYAVEAYVATGKDNKPEKRSKVKMNICKFSLTPLHVNKSSVTVDDTFTFLMGSGNVKLQGTLGKSVYLHDEHVTIDVQIKNDSTKVVKYLTVSVIQNAEIFLGTAADYDVTVVRSTCHEGFPLNGGKEWTRQFKLCPADQHNRDGFALDGALKPENSKLASSTYRRDKMANKENMGIVVNYMVEVRLIMHSAKDVQIRIPFALTHAPVKKRRGSIYASSKPRKERSKDK